MSLAVAAALVLGVVFLVAGALKIVSGAAWPLQARGLGAPAWVIPLLPWIEIALGAMLCAQLIRPVVAGVSAALLLAFSALLVKNLVRGKRPPCACFGNWRARSLGWHHVVRNAALIGIAAIAAIA